MAHIMNYAEIQSAAKKGNIIYEESRSLGLIRPLKFDGVDFIGVEHKNHFLLPCECDEEQCPSYNLYYRIWDERPTEEEMKNAPWKENPFGFGEMG